MKIRTLLSLLVMSLFVGCATSRAIVKPAPAPVAPAAEENAPVAAPEFAPVPAPVPETTLSPAAEASFAEATPPVAPESTPQPEPRRLPAYIDIAAVGDVLMSDFTNEVYAPDEGRTLWASVTDYLHLDLAFANLEGALADVGESSKCPQAKNKSTLGRKCYAFRCPEVYAPRIKEAGITMASLANNHAADYGEEARGRTMELLDGMGIAHSGRPGTVAWQEVKGLRVAMLAFTVYPHSNNLLNREKALALITETAAQADVLIVSAHMGAEGADFYHIRDETEIFHGEDRGNPVAFAHAAIDAGADLVLGHGPHLLRAMEVYRGRLIAYSLGNFLTYAPISLQGRLGVAAIVQARLAPDGSLLDGLVVPTIQGYREPPMVDPRATALRFFNEMAEEDLPRTGLRLDAEGRFLLAK